MIASEIGKTDAGRAHPDSVVNDRQIVTVGPLERPRFHDLSSRCDACENPGRVLCGVVNKWGSLR
jgi:hypothetical protein